MKVARLHGTGDIRLHEEPLPEQERDKTLVRVTAVGICGSDLHWFDEAGIGNDRLAHPLVLGHEFAAVVAGGVHEGQRVAVDPAIPCHSCDLCQEGHPNLCEETLFSGHSVTDGALREYMTWPDHLLVPIPDSISDEDGAMLEPLGVAIHTVDLGHLKTGSTVGIFGAGPIGLLTLQVARAAGATSVFVTDTRAHRLEAALRYGATDVFEALPGGEEFRAMIKATGGGGIDTAFEAAGENDAVDAAILSARPGARIVLAGIPSSDRTMFNASVARRKGLTLVMVRRMKHVYRRAVNLVEHGLVDVRSMVTHSYPIERVQEAFDTARRREGLKVVVRPT